MVLIHGVFFTFLVIFAIIGMVVTILVTLNSIYVWWGDYKHERWLREQYGNDRQKHRRP